MESAKRIHAWDMLPYSAWYYSTQHLADYNLSHSEVFISPCWQFRIMPQNGPKSLLSHSSEFTILKHPFNKTSSIRDYPCNSGKKSKEWITIYSRAVPMGQTSATGNWKM
jgi:hypothetical protein